MVSQVLAGQSYTSVAISAGIHPGQLYQWAAQLKAKKQRSLKNLKKKDTI
ncbi:helix-turn-helix domain-containing protein [Fusobacterium sp.]